MVKRVKAVGSPREVMIYCRREQSTRLHQCHSLKTSRTITFFARAETLVGAGYYWIAQYSLSFRFLYRLLDAASRVEPRRMLPRSRYRQWRIVGRRQAMTSITGGRLPHLLRQCTPRQSHACLHRVPTTPTVCCLYGLRMTTTHRIESLTSPFFGRDLHFAPHESIFLIHILL